MTNEVNEGNREGAQQRSETAETTDERNRSFGRRGALKLAGTAVAGAAALGTTGTAAAASYETVRIDPGEERVLSVGQWRYSPPGQYMGDSMENVLVDATASGAEVRIIGRGSDWAIRNVAIRGNLPTVPYAIAAYTQPGGTAEIENVWFGDGCDQEFLYVHRNHSGTMNVRNCYLANCDTGIYASAPAPGGLNGNTGGEGGTTHVENCYLKDVTYTHFLMGSNGDSVRNCVVDSPNMDGYGVVAENRWESVDFVGLDIRTNASAFKSGNTYGDQHGYDAVTSVIDCQVTAGNRVFAGGAGTYDAKDAGSSPDLTPPSGVPLTPEEAVSGEISGSSGSSTGPDGSDDSDEADSDGGSGSHEIVVASDDASYEFTVSGSVERLDSPGGDYTDGNRAYGSVHGWKDGYRYTGEVTSFSADGAVTVHVDGDEVDPDSLGSGETSSASSTDDGSSVGSREVVVSNVGSNEYVSYEFTADAVERLDSPSGDYVDGNRAYGNVHGWKDGYRVEGEISGFSADGDVTVYVDGDEVDPASLG